MSSARDFGLEVHGMSASEEIVRCPFHSDSKPSAWFNPRRELFYCAVCGFGLNGWQLAKRLGIGYEGIEFGESEPEDYVLIGSEDSFDLGYEYYSSYFQFRGVSREVIDHFGVRWISEPEPAAVMPITNRDGDVQGVQYRYIRPDKTGTRYRTMGMVSSVWPLHHLSRFVPEQKVIVVEGAWSAMRLASHISINSIFGSALGTVVLALLGAKANQGIVDILRPYRPIILYDGDQAGKTACRKMRRLSPTTPSFVVMTSPDDMDKVQLRRLVEQTREVWDENGVA